LGFPELAQGSERIDPVFAKQEFCTHQCCAPCGKNAGHSDGTVWLILVFGPSQKIDDQLVLLLVIVLDLRGLDYEHEHELTH
jgi:hypothetical protein